MTSQTGINKQIIETLYAEAMQLADETRTAFDLSGRIERVSQDEDFARISLSCEALRTTTRMMHIIAWLLNQRAFFEGEINEFQLRRHGRLPTPSSADDTLDLDHLDERTRDLVERTQRMFDRIARLDRAWRDHYAMQPTAVHRLRERLDQAVTYL